MIVHHLVLLLTNVAIFVYAALLLKRLHGVRHRVCLEVLVVGILLLAPLSVLANGYDLAFHQFANGTDLYTNLKIGEDWFESFIKLFALKTVSKLQRDDQNS